MPGPPHPSEPGRRPWGERSQGDSPQAASSSRAPRAGVRVIGGHQTREHPKEALPKGAGLSRRASPRRRLGAHGVTRAAAGTAWSPFCLRVRAAAGLWRCPPRPMWTLSPGDSLPGGPRAHARPPHPAGQRTAKGSRGRAARGRHLPAWARRSGITGEPRAANRPARPSRGAAGRRGLAAGGDARSALGCRGSLPTLKVTPANTPVRPAASCHGEPGPCPFPKISDAASPRRQAPRGQAQLS